MSSEFSIRLDNVRTARASERQRADELQTKKQAEEEVMREKHRREALTLVPEVSEAVETLRTMAGKSAMHFLGGSRQDWFGEKIAPLLDPEGAVPIELKQPLFRHEVLHSETYGSRGTGLRQWSEVFYFNGWRIEGEYYPHVHASFEVPLIGDVIVRRFTERLDLLKYIDEGAVNYFPSGSILDKQEPRWVGTGEVISEIPKIIAEHIVALEEGQ